MDSHYMLIPVLTEKENWKHKKEVKLSIEKGKEIQEFLMGRNKKIYISNKEIKCNSLNKRIINNFAIVEIDMELMAEFKDEITRNAQDNSCQLLTRAEMLDYIKEHEPEVL